MVVSGGIEPPTHRFSVCRSTNWAMKPWLEIYFQKLWYKTNSLTRVEYVGFEPTDPLQITVLQTAAVANAAHTPFCGGRCEIRTHGPFLIDDFQGRCINPLCQSSVLWWNVLDSNQLTHYRSRFYRPLQSPMLLTFHFGLRERIRTFDHLIPNQGLCQTELLGEICFKFNIRTLYIMICLVSNFIYIILFGLRERIRTFDHLIPNQELCQTELLGDFILPVECIGFEPMTFSL